MAKPDNIQKIIALIEGGKSERAACEEIGMNRSTFRTAVLREKVDEQYARALSALALDQAEKLEQAIDDMRNGVIDHKQARVEIDARKWFASKFLPRRFGDKLDLTTDGEKINERASLSDEELTQRISEITKRKG